MAGGDAIQNDQPAVLATCLRGAQHLVKDQLMRRKRPNLSGSRGDERYRIAPVSDIGCTLICVAKEQLNHGIFALVAGSSG